jgi:hypothetical protein
MAREGYDGLQHVAETLGPVGGGSGPSWAATRTQRALGGGRGTTDSARPALHCDLGPSVDLLASVSLSVKGPLWADPEPAATTSIPAWGAARHVCSWQGQEGPPPFYRRGHCSGR